MQQNYKIQIVYVFNKIWLIDIENLEGGDKK